MELSDVVGTPIAYHGIVVGFVIILAVLVFVFGFKTAEEPPFDKLTNTNEDRKPAGKKRKLKDKKSQSNGHVTAVSNEKSETKQRAVETNSKAASKSKSVKDEKQNQQEKGSSKDVGKSGKQEKKQQQNVVAKPALKENKNIKENKKENDLKASKKQENVKKQNNKNKGKENVDVQNKKNAEKKLNQKNKKLEDEKPNDYDEGEWEQASYRKDKKKSRVITVEEEVSSDKTGEKKETATGKKKIDKTDKKNEPNQASVEPESEKKAAKKDEKKEKKNEPAEKKVTPPAEEGDGDAKKKKKKGGKEEGENVAAEKTTENEAPAAPAVKITPAPKAEPEVVTNKVPEDNVVFDDFADSCPEKWKEPKTSKKSNSRKKVRKDQ